MSTRNDVTGDSLISKKNNDAFRQNFDQIDWSARKREKASQEDSLIPPEPAEANHGLAG